MNTEAILALIAQQTADYQNAADQAAKGGRYEEANKAQISAGVLMNLQQEIALMGSKKPVTSFKASAPAPTAPRKPRVSMPTRNFGSGKDWSLDGSLRPADIDRILGQGKQYRVSDDPGKVKFSWRFLVDGKECAIWDYKGVRWSAFGPKECFQALGFIVNPG